MKQWSQKYGSIDAEDGKGNGFGARTIIRNSLLDEGRATARSNRLFAGNETIDRDRETKGPDSETEEDESETNASPHGTGFDPSEDDYEKSQEAFEDTAGSSATEPTSLDTPRRRAQDAIVDRNVADIRGALSPYSRRLLELWHESPEDPRAKNPAWVSKAQKEYGIPRAQILKDFQELTDTVRQRVQQKGLTRDDFTRVSGAPRLPEEDDSARQERPDLYSPLNESRRDQGGIREGDRVSGGGRKEDDVRRAPSTGAPQQPQSPSEFIEGYLRHAGEHGLDLDDPDSLFHYAGATGQVVRPQDIAALRPYALKGGVEHEAYHVPGPDGEGDRVIKVTRKPGRQINLKGGYGLNPDAISYLDRLRKMNVIAPGLDYKVEGVTPKGTWPSLVTSMTHVVGHEPTPQALSDYMTKTLGFKDEGGNSYVHPSGLRLGDVHTGNMIETPDGRMAPIDVTVEGEPGGEVFPIGTDRPPVTGAASAEDEPGTRKEAFANRVANDERVNRQVRDAAYGREYTPIPNDFTAAEALHALDQDGVDKSYQRVMEDDAGKSGLDARQRVALGQQLMVRLQDRGDFGRAIDVVDKLSTYGKDLGQAVQAFSMWSRLTPAGVLTKYARIIKPAVDEARKPYQKVLDGAADAVNTADLRSNLYVPTPIGLPCDPPTSSIADEPRTAPVLQSSVSQGPPLPPAILPRSLRQNPRPHPA